MLEIVSHKPQFLAGKRLFVSEYIWRRSIFRFSKYNFFLNFFFKKLSYFSLLLQSKNFNFLDKANFRYDNFQNSITSFNLIKFSNNTWTNSSNYFFCEFKILGLGLRLKKASELNLKTIRLDLGYGHYIDYFLPLEIKCIRRKKKFVIFSYDLLILNNVIRHLEDLKPLNPYKVRGLKNIRRVLVLKIGKKQSQR
jgi:ribosomal protein L6P/L9E